MYAKGLGLFFYKMVTTAHKGRIWVELPAEGIRFLMAFGG
jgi:hypothetical protein